MLKYTLATAISIYAFYLIVFALYEHHKQIKKLERKKIDWANILAACAAGALALKEFLPKRR